MLRPYIKLMRLDKPIGIWLLFFPAGWAVTLAAPFHLGYYLVIMLLGAAITRAGGCIINDITDRRLDANVARTAGRPLAAGTVPLTDAYLLLAALAGIALGIALSLPRAVFVLALIAAPMIAAYPWMKRITWWPQLFLGLTFNLSALFGWLATGTPLTLTPFLLYAAGIFWTLGYDTIYAVQDMADDARVGIKSTALRLGRFRPLFVASCYALMVFFLLAAAIADALSVIAYAGILCVSAHALWQIRTMARSPSRAGEIFRSNQWLGLTLLLALLLERALA